MLGLIIWLSVLSVICVVETTLIVICILKKKKQEDNHFVDLKFCELENAIKQTNNKVEDLESSISILSARKK